MHTTTIQIKKLPEPLWMTTIWLDKSKDIILTATGVDESSSKEAMVEVLLDFQDSVTVKVQEALGKMGGIDLLGETV